MDDHIVAHHEAAHAVLALEAGLGILDRGIVIASVAKTGGLGSDGCRLFVADLTDVPAENLSDEQARLVGQIDRSGTVLAAGPASDAKLLGEDPWLALQRQRSDFAAMRNLLRRARFIDEDEVDGERLRAQVDLAVEALADPDIWKAIETVAQRTLADGGCLSGEAIERIAGPILDPSRKRWGASGRRR